MHVPIHPAHRQYLRFDYSSKHYQYCAMPFGLSSAPRTFTKLVVIVAAMLQTRPIRLFCYLDDILVLSSSLQQAATDIMVVIQGFQAHRLSINYQKSHLTPTTHLLHLGALMDSAKGQVFLSPDRIQSIKSSVIQVRSLRKVPLLHLSQLLGKVVSFISIIPWARRHTRPLQWFLLPFQKSGRASSKTPVSISP